MLRSALFCLCVFLCASASLGADARESRLVQTTQGPVRGYKDPDTGVYLFRSIPYASVPTGTNRYRAPLPPPTWISQLEAVDKNIICPQPRLYVTDNPDSEPNFISDMMEQEDCLIANVYVPDTQEKNIPVLVIVHGGAFQVGFGDLVQPTKFVSEQNIIAVTFNYRVGIHGFLCLGTEDVPGNAGMKDQVAALRWVKKNIASFGGSPDDISLEGYSAGSAAVDLLMLSKSAEGLFNKVIPESGASIGQWTIQSDPLNSAKQYAKHLNFTEVDDIYALEHFYKTASFELLNSVCEFSNPNSTFGPSPCVERATGEEIFLDKSPVDILKSGNYKKLPLLYGFANMEGLLRIGVFNSYKDQMNADFSDFLPADLKFESRKQKQEVANRIRQFYFGDKLVGEDTILGYVDFFTDVLFAYPMLRTVKYHVEAGHDQIYLYEYSFVDESTPVVPYTDIKGATHCAQTAAFFGGMPTMPQEQTNEFKNISTIVNEIWSSFIKTGNPIPKGSSLPQWPAVGAGLSPHMSLGNEISLRGPLLERRVAFWDEIYSKYYSDPIPPPKPKPRRNEL